MFDLKALISSFVQSFEDIASSDETTRANGYALFCGSNNDLKGNDTVESETFRAALVEAGLDVPRFQDNFASAEKALEDRFLAEQAERDEKTKAAAFATSVVGYLTHAVKQSVGNDKKTILSCVPVENFLTVTNYENNRDVQSRAQKQAKAVATGKDTSTHQNGDQVAVAMLDRERNSALWERTERVAASSGVPHTLPFIKVDGHTRAYGWSVPNPKEENQYLFARPESLFITVYKNQTDGEIYQLVQDYCNGVNKANNSELQQMGMKKIEFSPVTAFVAKDSWKTAFRTIDRKWGADTDAAIKEFQDALTAIDLLNIETKSTTKKLSGVRAALISSYVLCAETKGKKMSKFKEFWHQFFAAKTKNALILILVNELGDIGTGDAAKACEMCMDTFKEFAGLIPAPEVEESAAA